MPNIGIFGCCGIGKMNFARHVVFDELCMLHDNSYMNPYNRHCDEESERFIFDSISTDMPSELFSNNYINLRKSLLKPAILSIPDNKYYLTINHEISYRWYISPIIFRPKYNYEKVSMPFYIHHKYDGSIVKIRRI